MRNLKKVLSLALAMVMLLGMMVIGAGAVETQFADNDKVGETYKEAVAVMTEVGVLTGKENNNFDPEGTLTRAEAATILVRVTMGTEAAKGLAGVTKSGVFTDMSNHWAAGYVDACFNKGIVGGIGNSLYAPDSKLTGTQFAAMLMRAAGVEGDFTGSSWESAVIAAAAKAKLSEVTTGEISRQSAAKMAFDGVLYSPSGEKSYKVGDLSFDNFLEAYIANGSKTEGITVSTASDSLAKTVLGLAEDTQEDKFGNPQKVWKVDGEVVVTVPGVKSDKFFTAAFTADDLKDYKADKLTKDQVIIDGVKEGESGASANNTLAKIAALGGNGVEVSIYANSSKEITKVVVVKPYVGTVQRVTEAKGDDKRTVTVGGLKFETEDFAKDDVVIYTKADGKIQSMYQPNVVEGVQVTRKTGESSFVADGETYKYVKGYATSVSADVNANSVMDLYLDQYGFVAKVTEVEGTVDYAYVLDVRNGGGYANDGPFYAKLVMSDGTVVTDAEVNPTCLDSSDRYTDLRTFVGTIVKTTLNSDELYKLEKKSTVSKTHSDGYIDIKKGQSEMALGASSTDKYNANNKTIFLVKNGTAWNSYTGYANVPNMAKTDATGNFVLFPEGKIARVVVILDADITSTDIVYVLGKADAEVVSDGKYEYREYPAVVNGEITTVKVSGTAITTGTLYGTIGYADENNEILSYSALKPYNPVNTVVNATLVKEAYKDGVITLKDDTYAVSEDVEVYKLGTNSISGATMEELNEGDTVKVAIIKDSEVISVFYTEKATDPDPKPSEPTDTADIYVDISTPATVTVATTKDELSNSDAANAVYDAIEKAGYVVDEEKSAWNDSGKLVIVAKKDTDRVPTTFTWNPTGAAFVKSGIAITYNGTPKIIASTAQIKAVTGIATKDGYVKIVAKNSTTPTFKDNDSTDTLADGDTVTNGYIKVAGTGVTDLAGITEVSSGAAYYALGTDRIAKKTGSTMKGSGYTVSTTYYAFTDNKTFGELDTNGDLTFAAIGVWKVTYDKADGTTGAIGVADGAQPSDTTAVPGTYYRVGNGTTFKAQSNITSETISADTVIHGTYIKLSAAAAKASANSGITNATLATAVNGTAWNATTNAYVKLGETITVTVGVSGNGVKATANASTKIAVTTPATGFTASVGTGNKAPAGVLGTALDKVSVANEISATTNPVADAAWTGGEVVFTKTIASGDLSGDISTIEVTFTNIENVA